MNKYFLRYLGLAIASLLLGIASMVFFGILMSGFELHENYVDSEVTDVILRASSIVSEENNAYSDKAIHNVESGLMSTGDYLSRVFTSAEYLSENRDDSQFAEDLVNVVRGYQDSGDSSEVCDLLDDNNRLYSMNEYLISVDKSYEVTNKLVSGSGSSFDNCTVTKSLQGSDGYTIGIRLVEGDFSIDGDEVRTDFFVDGVLYQGNIRIDESDNGLEHFVMAWDTAGVDAGIHDVSILIRSSDGRGQAVAGGYISVPRCKMIENDTVVSGNISGSDSDSWYLFNAEDRNAYVNFVGLSDDIKVSLYNVCGDLIGENDNPGIGFELLRGYLQDVNQISEDTGIPGISNVFYVRASRGSECTSQSEDVSFTMVQTKEVAFIDGEYAAVLDEVGAVPTPLPVVGDSSDMTGEMITLKFMDGRTMDVEHDSINYLPINGYLEDLVIRNASTGNRLNIYPTFDSSTVNYAYYVDDETDFTVTATSAEGYAATVEIHNLSNDGLDSALQGQILSLADGENKLTVTVDSFTGEQKVYTIYLLNGDDNGDFCEDTLSQFPDSYKSGLWLMHSIHPEYLFVPYNTGLDYSTVLSNEDYGSRSLASYWTHPGWVKSDSPVYDGGGWMAAKYDVVNYFLDPRNFLDPEHIFEFEMLSFDSNYHTVDGVRAMIAGSFMDTSEHDFAQIIYDAGQTAGVSPYLLASRILQEMGYSGESQLCHGTLPGYEGYYNFYNIGSTPNPEVENGALINGARYAMWGRNPDEEEITAEEAALLLPWDNVEDAITGGALWIASGYTAVGQNTLYFQKFDVIDNSDGLYNHQYAQNISMAYTEGSRYFSSYSSINMLNQSFVFLIPVYDNMPESYGYLPSPD